LYKTWNAYLSYSDNYRVDFVLKKSSPDLAAIASGYALGEIYLYDHPSMKYSTDYGEIFVDKGTCPGWVSCMSVGHNPGEIYCGCYHGDVYYSSNYGETYDLVIDLAIHIDFRCISRGSEDVEIYLLDEYMTLYYSPNRCDSLFEQHQFDKDFITGMAAGLSSGEVYAVESEHYFEGGGDLYIHRSTDYGQTFTRYHCLLGTRGCFAAGSCY
jgi:hypothetical protein